jgi:hypothetical protein
MGDMGLGVVKEPPDTGREHNDPLGLEFQGVSGVGYSWVTIVG